MTATRDGILSWLERAVQAPSGDNAQPWRFRLIESGVEIHNAADADPTLYNFRERGSYVALGAVAENIRILAAASGFGTSIDVFPGDCVARLRFVNTAQSEETLADQVEKRATNRLPYAQKPLPSDARAALIAAAREVGISLTLAEAPEALDTLANTVSLNERLLMENQGLHRALFSMIRYSKAAERAAPGLYIKTMELPPPVEIMFRTLLRSWTCVRLMNLIGFSKTIPTQTAPVYRQSSAFGALTMQSDSDADFFAVGRAFQRVWLTATSLGLSMQPTAALPYLQQRIAAGEADMFTDEHKAMVRDAYTTLLKEFALPVSARIGVMFRIGYAAAPSATSHKARPILLA